MWSYRRLPEVCRHLSHDVLSRAEVAERITSRLPESQIPGGDVVCGLAVEVDGALVGDAMLRVVDGRQLWIGYGFHPCVWGRGFATEVASELVRAGGVLDLPVFADVFADNPASERVLVRAGLALQEEVVRDGRALRVFGHVRTRTASR